MIKLYPSAELHLLRGQPVELELFMNHLGTNAWILVNNPLALAQSVSLATLSSRRLTASASAKGTDIDFLAIQDGQGNDILKVPVQVSVHDTVLGVMCSCSHARGRRRGQAAILAGARGCGAVGRVSPTAAGALAADRYLQRAARGASPRRVDRGAVRTDATHRRPHDDAVGWSCAVRGGRVGDADAPCVTDVELFEPTTMAWRRLAPLPIAMCSGDGVELDDGRIFVGIQVPGSPSNWRYGEAVFIVYEPSTSLWTEVAHVPAPINSSRCPSPSRSTAPRTSIMSAPTGMRYHAKRGFEQGAPAYGAPSTAACPRNSSNAKTSEAPSPSRSPISESFATHSCAMAIDASIGDGWLCPSVANAIPQLPAAPQSAQLPRFPSGDR